MIKSQTISSTRGIRAVLLVCCLLVLVTVIELEAQAAQLASCSAQEVARDSLLIDGVHPVYVEPTALASVNGDLLLAGVPNYVSWRNEAGQVVNITTDSIFGVIVPKAGHPRPVPSPIDPSLIIAIRAVHREEGGWSVVFSEANPEYGSRFDADAIRIWHGIFNGFDWILLEEVPIPPAGRIEGLQMSQLAVSGDSISFAVPFDTDDHNSTAAVFMRVDDLWSYDILGTRAVAYIDVAHSSKDGFTLAVVRPDRELRQDSNSLFVNTDYPDWRTVRKIATGGRELIHRPSLEFTNVGHGVLSWWVEVENRGETRRELRAMLRSAGEWSGTVVSLDFNIVTYSSAISSSGVPIWVTDHIGSSREDRHLRIIDASTNPGSLLWQIENPFEGPFSTVINTSTELVVVGPTIDRAADSPVLTMTALKFALSCDG